MGKSVSGGHAYRRRSRGYATTGDVERELDVSVRRADTHITITKPFQTKGLIVRTNDKTKLKDTYGATQIAHDGNGLHLLQYATEEAARHDKNRHRHTSWSVTFVYRASLGFANHSSEAQI